MQDGAIDPLWNNRFQFLTIVSLAPQIARRLTKGMTRLTGVLRDRPAHVSPEEAIGLARALQQAIDSSAVPPDSLLAPSDLQLLRDLTR